MYKLLLILKYLRRKLAPLFAAAAVTLCTAMVIIVISVMGGFLEMMQAAVRTLSGDVTVQSDLVGFEHYDDLLARIVALPEARAATPLVRMPALLKIGQALYMIEVVGIEPKTYNEVTDYQDTLYWKPEHMEQAGLSQYQMLHDAATSLEGTPQWGEMPVMVPGIEVRPDARRDENGDYDPMFMGLGYEVTLTTLPVSKTGNVKAYGPEEQRFVIANEFKSGLYDIDKNRVFVHFDVLQMLLKMEPVETDAIDYETGELTGEKVREPGRAHEIMVAAADGVTVAQLASAVQRVVFEFQQQQSRPQFLVVETWHQRHSVLLNAVEKEKGLLTLLFAIISLVAIVMVAVIFYMIVLEKTRDIGTLRAIGASRSGIAGIFMGYGMAIGIVGSVLGFVLAYAIVVNLNEIQSLLYHWFGFKMWDPRVYYFERIPSRVNMTEASLIVIAAILAGLIGSIIPALLAARLDPVESLRYE
jgi:lipoprotein-releasing system permease protein